MNIIESFILIIASAIAFPLLLDWHKARLKKVRSALSEGETLTFWQRIASTATAVALLLAGLLVLIPLLINWLNVRNNTDSSKLQSFRVSDFKEEIVNQKKSQGTAQPDYTELMRAFTHAEELQNMNHFEEAERILLQIKRGQDEYGQFPRIESYVIENNLGVLAFLIRRNKNFEASDRILKAKRHPNLPPDKVQAIETNITHLNDAVNTLD